jgi:peptidoglycan-N-acetylglucosamine deacetylase
MRPARLNAAFRRGVDEAFFALRPSQAPVRRAPTTSPAVCLTFDDGPSSVNTPEVLDLLAQHDARGTFFVVGERIAGREALLRRMIAEGHEIGNHTYSHTLTFDLSPIALKHDLLRAADAIEAACSRRPVLARPPFGKDRRRFSAVAAECGARTILWSIDSGDAAEVEPHPDAVYSAVAERAEPGAIILLHDGGESRRIPTLGGCERILESLKSRGVQFATVSELLAEAPGLVAG